MRYFLCFLVFSASAIAQTNNCSIPGFPGCTMEDFNQAIREQRQNDLLLQQLNQQRRANALMEQQNQILQQLQMQNLMVPQNNYQQQQMQRCLLMPLGTPGC